MGIVASRFHGDFCVVKEDKNFSGSKGKSGFSICDNRSRTTLVKDFRSRDHIVEDTRLTGACLIEQVTVEIDTALADILIGDLYPVRLRTVYIAVEVVTDAFEVVVDFVVGSVTFPGADIIAVREDDRIGWTNDILDGIDPFFVVCAQGIYRFPGYA